MRATLVLPETCWPAFREYERWAEALACRPGRIPTGTSLALIDQLLGLCEPWP